MKKDFEELIWRTLSDKSSTTNLLKGYNLHKALVDILIKNGYRLTVARSKAVPCIVWGHSQAWTDAHKVAKDFLVRHAEASEGYFCSACDKEIQRRQKIPRRTNDRRKM